MEITQYLLRYTGTVTINHEYTVNLEPNTALAIDWFPHNDLIIETKDCTARYNTENTERLPDGRHLIQIVTTENLYDLPVQLERGDYLVAGDIVINHHTKEYFKADQLDILPDELVAAHGNQVTRILFSGTKSATEHYIKKNASPPVITS